MEWMLWQEGPRGSDGVCLRCKGMKYSGLLEVEKGVGVVLILLLCLKSTAVAMGQKV